MNYYFLLISNCENISFVYSNVLVFLQENDEWNLSSFDCLFNENQMKYKNNKNKKKKGYGGYKILNDEEKQKVFQVKYLKSQYFFKLLLVTIELYFGPFYILIFFFYYLIPYI